MKLYELFKKGAKGKKQVFNDFFDYPVDLDQHPDWKPSGCCALGAMCIGADLEIHPNKRKVLSSPITEVGLLTDQVGVSLRTPLTNFVHHPDLEWIPDDVFMLLVILNDEYRWSFARIYRCLRLLYRAKGDKVMQSRFISCYPELFDYVGLPLDFAGYNDEGEYYL